MKKLRVCVIDLINKTPTKAVWTRIMNANFANLMPQVIATWCEQEGHEVCFLPYTGFEDFEKEIPKDADMVFISSFSHTALLAYALSNRLRANGAITVLGGPHARCYPQDALKYFDYVFGFTKKELLRDVLQDCSQHRPVGQHVSANKQPESLPGVRERWRFIKQTLDKAPFIKIVPMIGSMGCPYTCSFCIDSTVPYQLLSFDLIKEDLQFLRTQFKRPWVVWHDPNFGIKFDEYMTAIEESIPPDSITFIAESSLSLLSEPHLQRLKNNGFWGMLPGIESWFDLGNKSRTGKKEGLEKLNRVAEHVNMVLDYIPYVQTNFVLGLDNDAGPLPFELSKKFIDMSPGAFPGYSLLTSYGQAAPLNLEYQRENRVLPFPFHFLNSFHCMNLKPKNYSWPEFYDHVIDLTAYTFSWPAIIKRLRANRGTSPRLVNFLRAVSNAGHGRLKYYKEIRRHLRQDSSFRAYFDGETTELPAFFLQRIKNDLGPLWEWLPEGALFHDPNAYLKSQKRLKVEKKDAA